ncbi:glycosyltransferase family 1 protein, partial [bacterium (Candidatus Torokbacteria) CG09_land_8_20_14_0_10_42_11]
EKKALETYARKNNLSNIQFLGYKNSEELQKIISACRFVVIPSLWQEVFGLVILEAFRLGKTVIAADKGGIAEIIQEGNTGFFFRDQKDLKQKIQSLYNNPSL